MRIILNDEQAKWLRTIVRYRVQDERFEMKNYVESRDEEMMAVCQQRLDMWQSILNAIDAGVEQ